jgi:hypothetical protein
MPCCNALSRDWHLASFAAVHKIPTRWEVLRTLLVTLTVTKTGGPPFRFRQSRLTSQASDHCRDIAASA